MKTREWPLVVFTLLSQAAVGILLSWLVLEQLGLLPIQPQQTRAIPMVITLLLAFGGAAAGLHLRRPERAVFAAANWKQSWLSREMIFALLLGTSTTLLTLFYLLEITLSLPLAILKLASLLSAVLLLWSMIRLYELRTVPAWNLQTTFLAFSTSTLLLGPASLLLILLIMQSPAGIEKLAAFALQPILFWTAGLAMLQAISLLGKVQVLNNKGRAGLKSKNILRQERRRMFRIHTGLSALLALLLILAALGFFPQDTLSILVPGLVILVWVVEVIGRTLFYASYVRHGL